MDFGSGSADGSGSGSFDEGPARGGGGGRGSAMSDRSDWPRVLAERKKSSSSVSKSSRSSTSRSKPKVPDEELDPIDAIARASGVQLTVDQSDSEDSLDELMCATTSNVARAFESPPETEEEEGSQRASIASIGSNGMKRELDAARARIRAFEDEVDALRDENARLREALDASGGGAVAAPEVVSASADYES